MSSSEPVALRLIDREFLIACEPEERDGLLEAAGFLDRKMRELRANAKAPSFERLAVLTAISVAARQPGTAPQRWPRRLAQQT
jgi:cell division protein ZapA